MDHRKILRLFLLVIITSYSPIEPPSHLALPTQLPENPLICLLYIFSSTFKLHNPSKRSQFPSTRLTSRIFPCNRIAFCERNATHHHHHLSVFSSAKSISLFSNPINSLQLTSLSSETHLPAVVNWTTNSAHSALDPNEIPNNLIINSPPITAIIRLLFPIRVPFDPYHSILCGFSFNYSQ